MENHPPRSKALPRGLALGIVLLAAAGASWLILDKIVRAPGEVAGGLSDAAVKTAKEVAKVVKEAVTIEPKIVSTTTVIHEGARETLELVLAERDQITETRYENSWAGSKKVLHVRGKFRVKAGYKLDDGNWFVDQRSDGSYAVKLPDATVLSCEQMSIDMLEDEDGFWNRLSKEERAQVQNQLLAEARRQAATGDLLKRAESEIERRLTESAKRHQLNKPPMLVPMSPAT